MGYELKPPPPTVHFGKVDSRSIPRLSPLIRQMKRQSLLFGLRHLFSHAIPQLLMLALGTLLSAGLVVLLLVHPAFAINEITIQNSGTEHTRNLPDTVQLFLDENIFTLSVAELRQTVQQNPWVKTINVRRVLPASLTIEVVERTPLLKLNGFFVAGDGVVIGPGTADRTDLPNVWIASVNEADLIPGTSVANLEGQEAIRKLLQIKETQPDSYAALNQVTYTREDGWQLSMNQPLAVDAIQGWRALFTADESK